MERTLHVNYDPGETPSAFLDLGRGPKNPVILIQEDHHKLRAYVPGCVGSAVNVRIVGSSRNSVICYKQVHVMISGWTGPFGGDPSST